MVNVHNHGPAEGPGLGCPERRTEIGGYLRGACLPDPVEPEPYCDHGPLDACRCLAQQPVILPGPPADSVYMRGKVAAARRIIAQPAPEVITVDPPELLPAFIPSALTVLPGLQVRTSLGPGDQIAAIVKDHDGRVLGYIAQSEADRIRGLPSLDKVRAYAVLIGERIRRGEQMMRGAEIRDQMIDEGQDKQ